MTQPSPIVQRYVDEMFTKYGQGAQLSALDIWEAQEPKSAGGGRDLSLLDVTNALHHLLATGVVEQQDSADDRGVRYQLR